MPKLNSHVSSSPQIPHPPRPRNQMSLLPQQLRNCHRHDPPPRKHQLSQRPLSLNRDSIYKFVRSKDPGGLISKNLVGWEGTFDTTYTCTDRARNSGTGVSGSGYLPLSQDGLGRSTGWTSI
ncbi:hypothetical protein QBC32DRAFT_352177 [Pseudoneurospora amorphoporcata]|uniref:Uncharacterized protein n=1 Tax=Pseudoneurospora amorphoporcata TaxID=241081 RepID=A0AAN6NLS6_9PEZI|nr:hypothetical protein QBC32DRAFT_352177 [Pseudoneurospora amorphoporcata]